MTLETFHKAFGQEYDKAISNRGLRAAIALIRTQRMEMLLSLSPEDIRDKSLQILGGVIESVRFEKDLVTLNEKREFKMPDEAQIHYITPEEEAEQLAAIEEFRSKKTTKRRAA